MRASRPFRFGTGAYLTASGTEWAERARRAEALGYATFLIADHFSTSWFAPGPALTAAALATTTLRVGCTVFDNDFRHPALLAKEAATVDVLTGGRLEFGIGAGWYKPEYDQVGLPFDPPGVRVSRLQEAVHIIKGSGARAHSRSPAGTTRSATWTTGPSPSSARTRRSSSGAGAGACWPSRPGRPTSSESSPRPCPAVAST